MALDGIVLHKLVKHLNESTPIRINKIYSIGKNELLFNVRTNKKSEKLIISGDANQNRIHFTHKNYPNDHEPTNFVMLLRKYLTNGQITHIKQYNYDRVLRLTVETFSSIGDPITFYLYLELMGRYANIIFCDEQNVIFDAIKRISPLENPHQIIVPGATYVNPADMNKHDLFSGEIFDINESLVKQFSGVSPTLEKEIRHRLQTHSFEAIVQQINHSNNLIISSNDRNSDFHIIEMTHQYSQFKTIGFDDGFDLFFFEKSQQERIKQETNDLLRFLRKESKKLKKKLVKIHSELENNQNSEINLKYGDLLMTYHHDLKKGAPHANLIDYDTNETVTIQLDEKLTPIENAQRYYKLYKKQTKSIAHLTDQIKITNEELDYFNLLIEQLQYADIHSAKEIRQELVDKKYLFEKEKYNRKKKTKKPNFLSIDYNGVNIKVGKNNVQNDYILKQSNRNDYWFHVQTYHGSHVIVNAVELTDEVIKIAATLAAHFSQAKHSQNVTVDYTQVRNVKRTGTKGLVRLKEFDSVTIENDETLIQEYL